MEQALAALRPILAAAGVLVVSFGWVPADQVATITNAILQIAGAATTIGSILWAIWARRQTALVAAVNAMPEVSGVVTAPTAAGTRLAAAVGARTVAPAGSQDAADVAGATVPFRNGH